MTIQLGQQVLVERERATGEIDAGGEFLSDAEAGVFYLQRIAFWVKFWSVLWLVAGAVGGVALVVLAAVAA